MEILAETGTVYRGNNKADGDDYDYDLPTIEGEVLYTTLQKKGFMIED